MNIPLLNLENLHTTFNLSEPLKAVDGVSLKIQSGETFALLGESGSGKSVTALSIMRLLPEIASIEVGGLKLEHQDLTKLTERQMRTIRGQRIGMIFQEPMTSLNPVMTVGEQVNEVLKQHLRLRRGERRARVIELFDQVGIPEAAQRVNEYPHQLSGGMKQRVMIAMALACEPDLLIADEPTTALDVTIQAQILALLRTLQQKNGMSILLITHDLGVVSEMADQVAVMYAGQIVEKMPRDEFFAQPHHPYSRQLLDAMPSENKRGQQLEAIPCQVPSLDQEFDGCRFADRCRWQFEPCAQQIPEWTARTFSRKVEDYGVRCHLMSLDTIPEPPAQNEVTLGMSPVAKSDINRDLVEINDLRVLYPIKKGIFQRTKGFVYAVDGVSLKISAGRTLALVGESGCGKTTVGKSLLQLLREESSGRVSFDGFELSAMTESTLRQQHRRHFQMIFQDPYASMNPRMRISEILQEGIDALGVLNTPEEKQQRIESLLIQVGLSADMQHRYPHAFSGGQRQRICIARALAVEPDFIVCDEPTSALDVSVQAQILNMLQALQSQLNLAFLFITHDLGVVSWLAHDVAVMYLGRIVEQGTVNEIMQSPQHPYTQALLAAVPVVQAVKSTQHTPLYGDIPSPMNPPSGCHFHPRCPQADDLCRTDYPPLSHLGKSHQVCCHHFGKSL
jgi:peptide/nickel transport system ATP-binding protein